MPTQRRTGKSLQDLQAEQSLVGGPLYDPNAQPGQYSMAGLQRGADSGSNAAAARTFNRVKQALSGQPQIQNIARKGSRLI